MIPQADVIVITAAKDAGSVRAALQHGALHYMLKPFSFPALKVAERVGVSRATAQRYLSHLHEAGRVSVRLRYGASGRPEHRYHWSRGTVGA